MEELLAIVLLGGVVALGIFSLHRTLKGKGCGCSCGCDPCLADDVESCSRNRVSSAGNQDDETAPKRDNAKDKTLDNQE